MIESVIMTLIYICLLAIVVYLVLWVLEQIGVTIPAQVMKLLWVIVVLIVVLMLVKSILPAMGVRIGTHNGAAYASEQIQKANYEYNR